MTSQVATTDRVSRHLREPGRAVALAWNLVRTRLRERDIRRRQGRFWRLAQSVVADCPRPVEPRGVAVFVNCGFLRDGGMYALVMRRLSERRWHVASLQPDLHMKPPDSAALARLDGMLVRESATCYRLADASPDASLRQAWEIDLTRRICRSDGIEYFPIVAGKLRRLFKAYDLDFGRPDVAEATRQVIASADAALTVCHYLRDEVASRGMPVRIIGAEHLYVPSGVFMEFCARKGRHDGMEFVDFSGAYSHYFSAGEYLERHSYAVQNITRRNSISRHIVHRDDFERWLSRGQDGAAARREALRLMRQSWTGQQRPPGSALALIERIRTHRERGGKVACAFGHVGFDLGVPRDIGDAHEDMVDWLNDTIAALNDTDTLLLVKPHPTEKRYKPNRRPNQLLEELIRVPRADNVVLMDALWLNSFEMIGLIDVGLIWRSNVALELTISGVPAIVAGREAAYRGVVDLIYPRDRDHYHTLLRTLGTLRADEAQGERCALFLKYLSEETFINLPYVRAPGLRQAEGVRYVVPVLEWDELRLRRFLDEGDPAVDRVCDEIMG